MSLCKREHKKTTVVSARPTEHKLLVYVGCLAFLIATAGCSKNTSADKKSYAEFMAARELVTQGHYTEAIGKLETYLDRHPKTKYSSRAAFFLAKAHLGANDIEQAQKAWERTIRDYPTSLEANKAKYKLALLTFFRGDSDAARTQFKAIAENPDGPLAPEAAGFARYLETHQK